MGDSFKAIEYFQAQGDTELSLNIGDIVVVEIFDPAGWSYGYIDQRRGWFPSNHVITENNNRNPTRPPPSVAPRPASGVAHNGTSNRYSTGTNNFGTTVRMLEGLMGGSQTPTSPSPVLLQSQGGRRFSSLDIPSNPSTYPQPIQPTSPSPVSPQSQGGRRLSSLDTPSNPSTYPQPIQPMSPPPVSLHSQGGRMFSSSGIPSNPPTYPQPIQPMSPPPVSLHPQGGRMFSYSGVPSGLPASPQPIQQRYSQSHITNGFDAPGPVLPIHSPPFPLPVGSSGQISQSRGAQIPPLPRSAPPQFTPPNQNRPFPNTNYSEAPNRAISSTTHQTPAPTNNIFTFQFCVETLHPYIKVSRDQLSFAARERLDIIEKPLPSSEWWRARNKAGEMGMVPKNYVNKKPNSTPVLAERLWYRYKLSREVTLDQMRNKPIECYVIRDSEAFPGCFTLSVKGPDRVRHIKITTVLDGYEVGDKKFPSLDAVVDFYRNSPIYIADDGTYKLFLSKPLL